MIRIRYIPPSAPLPHQEVAQPPSFRPDQIAYSPFELEQMRLTQGTRSRLAVERVGTRGRRRRNERDALALSKEWQALQSKTQDPSWQTLRDATTILDPGGQPSLQALRQAQRQLRQWFFKQAQQEHPDEDAQRQASRVDDMIERLLRRNVASGIGPTPHEARGGLRQDEGVRERVTAAIATLGQGRQSAGSLHRKGMRQWAAGQPEAAIASLEAAALKAPKSSRIQLDLGRVLMDEGHFAEAEWTLLAADELAPKRSGAQVALGELYLEMGQPLMAIQAFKAAAARNPKDTDAQTQLGVAYYEQGELPQATEHLQKAVMLDQQGVVARFYLAQISLQENDLLRARFQLGMVAQLDPTMDLERFSQQQDNALPARTAGGPTPQHHWQLPTREAPKGTGTLRRTPTGDLGSQGTSSLTTPPTP